MFRLYYSMVDETFYHFFFNGPIFYRYETVSEFGLLSLSDYYWLDNMVLIPNIECHSVIADSLLTKQVLLLMTTVSRMPKVNKSCL